MLAPHVLEATGWEYVNEGTDAKPKKGYVSKTPGSVLKLKVREPVASGGGGGGWDYVHEGTEVKLKKGCMSKTPGSVLKLKVRTSH